jgi:hypothetical protein
MNSSDNSFHLTYSKGAVNSSSLESEEDDGHLFIWGSWYSSLFIHPIKYSNLQFLVFSACLFV